MDNLCPGLSKIKGFLSRPIESRCRRTRASWLCAESLGAFSVGKAADGKFIDLVKRNKHPNFEPIFQMLRLSPTLYSELVTGGACDLPMTPTISQFNPTSRNVLSP